MVIVLTWLGCARPPGLPTPGPRPVEWDITVAVASGDRALTALYRMHTEPIGRDVWLVRTVRTRGAWVEGGVEHAFDSAAPTAGDPWPLTLQHLVANVPAAVRMSERGVPEAIVDFEAWSDAARGALYASDLPIDALASGDALLDADGLLEDLRRTFPGRPQTDGAWERIEQIAGVVATRTETCEVAERGDLREWTCEGRVVGPERGPASLHDVVSWTRVVAEANGIQEVETSYSGTLVMAGPGGAAIDRPIAGRRLVERK